MRVALYARVSTCNGQSPEMQVAELRECASRRGQVFSEYVDHGISASKESRPELNRLMADAHRRNFDVVLCWKVDRFGRSLKHLVNALAPSFPLSDASWIHLLATSAGPQAGRRPRNKDFSQDTIVQGYWLLGCPLDPRSQYPLRLRGQASWRGRAEKQRRGPPHRQLLPTPVPPGSRAARPPSMVSEVFSPVSAADGYVKRRR
jgi:hypothetical protein